MDLYFAASLALVAAMVTPLSPLHAAPGTDVSTTGAADSSLLASALSGQTLRLTMRGTSVAVVARAEPAEDGCATLISAQAPGGTRTWTRLFRWGEIGWAGAAPDGRTMVSFYEPEGHLPADSFVVAPADSAAFRAALTRLVAACRAVRGESERVMMASKPAQRGCYFARLPSLHLLGGPTGAQPRAMLSVLARETPQAELQLLVERAPPDPGAGGDEWGRPTIAFTFADPGLKAMRIASAGFALDGGSVAAEHALTAYGDTRLRIRMDPFAALIGDNDRQSFYRRLADSGEASLTLLDAAGQVRTMLNFDAGPALAAARKALTAAHWSCANAAPAPEPAARWQRID